MAVTSFFTLLLAATAVVVLVGLVALALIIPLSRRGRGGRHEIERERGMIQELHADFEKMEKRIESLETILVEEIKKRPSTPTEDGDI
jgi:phage shock protein B